MSTFSQLSRYVFGTTRMGDGAIQHEERVKTALAAMDSGVWFQTSHQYGDALTVLRAAFDQAPEKKPNLIYKIGWSSVEEVEGQIRSQIEALGKERMEIGQLCPGGDLAEDIKKGGPSHAGLMKLKESGLVNNFVLEVFPWTSSTALEAIKSDNAAGLIDAVIFYLNPLQRFASNELWDLIQEKGFPIVAMRTVSGGDIRQLAVNAWAEYQKPRAQQVLPLFEDSGIEKWSEFSARFSLGLPGVKATVGATSRLDGLAELLQSTSVTEPLDSAIVEEILAMQRTWSDEVDMKAEPWTM
jgi:aryl-alcohol dehydrogenase-like predicted oxidoreductase